MPNPPRQLNSIALIGGGSLVAAVTWCSNYFKGRLPQAVPAEELPDYRRMQDGYRQGWN